jgi:hypothetical protein
VTPRFDFSTQPPDGKMAVASRPATGIANEIEAADDFVLQHETIITEATFTGLLPAGAATLNVVVEFYRLFPKDSDVTRTNGAPTFGTTSVPTRAKSPADFAFQTRSKADGTLISIPTLLALQFTVQNSVQPGGIHAIPNQTTGGDGPVSGEEMLFDVIFKLPVDLPPDHYFFVPQVTLDTGGFFWLSSPFPVGGSSAFTPDLQMWTRDANLAPDWLRVGSDIVGGAPAPFFNGTFSLTGHSAIVPLLAVGADAGAPAEIKAYNAVTGDLLFDFSPYNPGFRGGVRVAVADVNGDGVPDLITAPGPGGGPEVKVFDGSGRGGILEDFYAYDPHFTGGVFVAAADLNGDGKADIITAPDVSGGPDVRVFYSGNNSGIPDKEFMAYDPRFTGGVRLAVADFTGDGKPDIATSPGIFSGPDVRIFDGQTLAKVGEFLAYDFRYFGGVFVAAGDVNGDGRADLVTGTNGNGGPEVKAFDGTQVTTSPTPAILLDFFAYDPAFNGGARVAVLDTNNDGKADIVTGAGPGGGPHVRIFEGGTGNQLPNAQDSFFAFDPTFTGGVFVGGQ